MGYIFIIVGCFLLFSATLTMPENIMHQIYKELQILSSICCIGFGCIIINLYKLTDIKNALINLYNLADKISDDYLYENEENEENE